MSLARLPRSWSQIRRLAQKECETISLGQLLRQTSSDTASLQHNARWLREQLPIRFARRIEDILQLPHVVVSNPNISSILETYVNTFESVSSFPDIKDSDSEQAFLRLIKRELVDHSQGTRLVAEGYREVRSLYPHIKLDDFLHDHFTTRIATRILMDNYVSMRSPREGYVGVVCQGMRPLEIVQDTARDILHLCQSLYGCSPEVEYRGNLDCVLDYIPRHVIYMVRELLKNAFRSTIERRLARGGARRSPDDLEIPKVAVELQQGDIHVVIKISDLGGGMPKHVQKEAWQYGWSTIGQDAESETAVHEEESWSWDRQSHRTTSKKSELAGYGFGLPLTRLHAQYFGGDVFMQALPGLGTDMYLILTHLKEGTPSTEIDDLSTVLYTRENSRSDPLTNTS